MIPDPKPRATREQERLEVEVLSSDAAREKEAQLEPLRRRLSQALQPVLDPRAASMAGFGAGDDASDAGLLSWNKVRRPNPSNSTAALAVPTASFSHTFTDEVVWCGCLRRSSRRCCIACMPTSGCRPS
jgi:hypothetical protein